MATDLIPITPSPGDPGTSWRPLRLTSSLAAKVGDKSLWAADDARLPALSPDERDEAARALAVYDEAPRGSSPERVAALFGAASIVMPARGATAAEAKLRLAAYQEDLADIDSDILGAAFREARRTMTFMPSIAELRAIASRLPAPPRVFIAWRLRQLMAAPADTPAVDAVGAGEVGQLLDSLRPAVPGPTERMAPRAADRSVPTLDDYRAIPGITEEEALEVWDQHLQQMRGREHGALPRELAA
jgi:hypothetical protein